MSEHTEGVKKDAPRETPWYFSAKWQQRAVVLIVLGILAISFSSYQRNAEKEEFSPPDTSVDVIDSKSIDGVIDLSGTYQQVMSQEA